LLGVQVQCTVLVLLGVQVQGQVKKTKCKFDRLKLDTMQKVDLLAASRSNMLSQVLVRYQSSMLNFWEKMSYRMTAVADSFKGYQYYEFNMLKVASFSSSMLDLFKLHVVFFICCLCYYNLSMALRKAFGFVTTQFLTD